MTEWNFVVEARKVGAIGMHYPVRLTCSLPAQTTAEAQEQFFKSGYSKEWEVNYILSVSPVVRTIDGSKGFLFDCQNGS